MKKTFLLLSLLLLGFSYGYSGHVMGADISWECLGNDSFRVTTTVYRDCNGVALSSTPTSLRSTCGSMTLVNTKSSGKDITPICRGTQTRCASSSSSYKYGFQEYKLTSIVDLSSWRKSGCCGVTISWQQCCRNNGVTTGPANSNFYVEALMNICQSPCASSPKWAASPTNLLCKGADALLNMGVDISSGSGIDNVTYSLGTPKTSTTGNANYSGKFKNTAPLSFLGFPRSNLPAPRGFHLDSKTGELSFRPMSEEHAILVINVDLYKKGKKIGEMSREFDLIVMKCPSNAPPVISGINCKSGASSNLSYDVCVGGEVCFKVCTTDGDTTDSVSLYYGEFGQKISGASFNIINAGSRLEQGEFCWTPKANDVGSHSFVLSAHDNKCPVPGSSTRKFTINVKKSDTIKPSMNVTAINQCGRYKMVMTEAAGKNLGKVLWFINDTIPIGTGDSIEYSFTQKGGYKITGAIDSCHNIQLHDTLNINKISNLEISNLTDQSICAYQTLSLSPTVSGGVGTLTYTWKMDTIITADSLNARKTNLRFPNRIGFYQITLEVKDIGSGCVVSKSINVLVKESVIREVDRGVTHCIGQMAPVVQQLKLVNGDGSWTGNGVSNNTFSSKGLSSGTYLLEYSLEDSLSCLEDTAIFTLRDRPTVSAGGTIGACLGASPISLSGSPSGGIWSGKGVVNSHEFDPQIAGKGTHQLVYFYEDSFGCNDSGVTKAKVFDYPVKVTAPDSAYSCVYGAPFNITGSPKGGKWFGGGFASSGETLNIDPASTGTGTFEIIYSFKDSNQCIGSDTSRVIIYETPTASFEVLDSVIDQNDTLPVQNNSYEVNGSAYLWVVSSPTSKSAIGFQPRIEMDQLGMHDITLYTRDSVSGCMDTLVKKRSLRVIKFVGIGQNIENQLSVYPNPAQESFFIENGSSLRATLEVVSSNGKVVIRQSLNPGLSGVNIARLPNGIYQLSLFNEEIQQRTVIQKQ